MSIKPLESCTARIEHKNEQILACLSGNIDDLRVLKRRAMTRRIKMDYRIRDMNAEIAHKVYLMEDICR